MNRFRGRRSALTWWWSLARSDFVAGAVNRDLSTCGLLSDIGGSLEQKLHFGILMLSLEGLLLGNALAGLRDVNLDVQFLMQAQHFVQQARKG